MKKLIALLLALVMVLSLVACGAKEEAKEETKEEAAAETKEEAAEEETAEEAAPAEGGELVIGGIGPLTGDYANYGNSAKNGAQIAVDEINAAGGINGMQVVLNYQDSVGDPDSATAAYGKLIDSGMQVSLGGVLSGETASIAAAAVEDGLLLLTPTASADDCIATNPNAFRVCFTDSSQGVVPADYIADKGLAEEVAVFYQSDIDYSVGLYESFKAECEAKGVKIVEVQTFTKDTATDFSTQINALAASGVKLIFIPIYAAEASVFLTQASGKLDAETVFFGADGLDGILGKVSDPVYAENVMMITPFNANDPAENVANFVAAYEEAHGATPDQFAADGYDAVYSIKAVIEHANVTPDDADFNEKLVAAMLEITVEGVTGTMTWIEDGNTVKDPKVLIIHDGVAVPFEG